MGMITAIGHAKQGAWKEAETDTDTVHTAIPHLPITHLQLSLILLGLIQLWDAPKLPATPESQLG